MGRETCSHLCPIISYVDVDAKETTLDAIMKVCAWTMQVCLAGYVATTRNDGDLVSMFYRRAHSALSPAFVDRNSLTFQYPNLTIFVQTIF